MNNGLRSTPRPEPSSLNAARSDALDVECPVCVCEFAIDRATLLAERFAECPDCGHECGIADLVNDD